MAFAHSIRCARAAVPRHMFFGFSAPRLWAWGVVAAVAAAGLSAQDLPTSGDAELARNWTLLQQWIARPQAVIPLTEIADLRFSTSKRETVRGHIEWAAKAKSASPLVRARAEMCLSDMDVDAGRLDAATVRRRRLGFIRPWFVIGAFDNEGKAGFDHEYPPEKGVQLDHVYEAERGEARWRETDGLFPLGDVNLFNIFRPRLKAVAYAAAWIKVDKAETLALRLATDDAVKAWVNGKLVLAANVYRPMTFDQDAVAVRLAPGWNMILLKVCQDEGEWEFRARLTFPDGRPFTAFKTATKLDAAAKLEAPEPRPAGQVKVQTLRAAFEAAAAAAPKSAAVRGRLAWFYARTMPFDINERRAEAEYQRAIELAPWFPVYYYRLGQVATEANQSRQALERAVALAPQFAQPRYMLALHYFKRGNYRKAMKHADLAIEQDPSVLGSYLVKAEIMSRHYAKPLALGLLAKVRKRAPNSPALLMEMASIADSLGQIDQAQAFRKQVLALSHFHAEARADMAEEAKTRGQLDAFLKQYDELLRLTPSATGLMLKQAQLLRAWGKFARAEALCRRALAVCPQDDEAAELLGCCLHDQGKTDAAMDAWRLALELKPQNPELKEYIEFLRPDEPAFESDFIYDVHELIAKAPGAKDFPQDSVLYLLSLTVRRVHRNGLQSSLHQQVFKILTDKGARDSSHYSVTYVPDTQRFITKQARIIKPSGQIVAIGRPQTRSYKSRDSDKLHYDKKVKVFYIRNLEVGDVVEIQYQIDDIGNRNEFAGYFGAMTYLQWASPCMRKEFVLISPKEMSLYFNAVRSAIEPKVAARGNDVVWRWTVTNMPGLVSEPKMPGHAEIAPYLHVSTYKSWEDLGRWYAGLIRDQFALDDRGAKLAREVTAGKKTELDKIKALHNYLARNTRYVGLEFGIHGFKPYPAWQVLARGYGDCKDKATLLCSLLGEVGVEAQVALVRTRDMGAVDPFPPSLHVFDHVIAYVPKHQLWLDCTVRFSGATELPYWDQGVMALIVNRDGTSKLTTTPRSKAEDNIYVQNYDIELNADGAATMRLERTVAGRGAASYRSGYAIKDKRRLKLERKWGKLCPGARVSDVKFSDLDDLERPVRYSCHMKLPHFAVAEGGELAFEHNLTRYRFVETYASLSTRQYDLVLDCPYRSVFHTVVRLPQGYKVVARLGDATLKSPFGTFKRTCAVQGGQVKIEQTIQMDVRQVKASAYPAFRQWCAEIDAKLREKVRIAK